MFSREPNGKRIRENDGFTGSDEPDEGSGRGAGVNNDEFEPAVPGGGEEMVESPFESVKAVGAVVDADQYHRFLGRLHGRKPNKRKNDGVLRSADRLRTCRCGGGDGRF